MHLLRHRLRALGPFDQSALDHAVHDAAWLGRDACLRVLLQNGADMYSFSANGERLLVAAVCSGNTEAVRVLLQHGYEADWGIGNSSDTGHVVPLHVAISRSSPQIVDVLLNYNASTEFRDIDGDTAIIAATSANRTTVVQKLIAAKACVNVTGFEGNAAIHRAIEVSNLDLIHSLLDAKADINKENNQGYTPLMIACEYGFVDCVQVLLERGASVSLTNKDRRTALHLAAVDGSLELLQLLMKTDINLNAVDTLGNTSLIIATFMRHSFFAEELLKQGADVNIQGEHSRTAAHWACKNGLETLLGEILKQESSEFDTPDVNNDTPCLLAAKSGQHFCQSILLDAGADFCHQGVLGNNVLHWAALIGCPDFLVRMVLARGVTVDAINDKGNTALILAAAHNRHPLMVSLMEHHCDVNIRGADGKTALHWVCLHGYHDMAVQLLQAGACPDIKDDNGDTALTLAACQKHVDVTEELLAHDLNINSIGSEGRTVLHWAAAGNLTETLAGLLEKKAEVNIVDSSGDIPLMVAARNYHRDIVSSLVEAGSDVRLPGKDGKTALYYMTEIGCHDIIQKLLVAGAAVNSEKETTSALIQAAKRGHIEVLRLLLSHKAVVDHVDQHCRTALLWSAVTGDTNIARCLIEHGADTRWQDKSGDTALTLAAWHGHPEILEHLLALSDLDHCENEEQMSALYLAISKDHKDCVQLLLKAGARTSIVDGLNNTALILAATHTTGPDILTMVLDCDQPVDLNWKGDKGRTAVHWAVGDPDSLSVLLENSSAGMLDIDVEDDNAATPLLLAIAHEQPESARLLIEAGCNIEKLHFDGRYPIHHTSIYGDVATLDLLLRLGVNPDTLTEDGRPPLILATIEGHTDVVKLLLQNNCKVNLVYKNAITPLYIATDHSFYDIMALLLNAAAEPDLIGVDKLSPVMTCLLKNDVRGLIMLLQANADVDCTVDRHGNRPLHVSIVNNNVVMMSLLAQVECDVNYVRSMLAQGTVPFFLRCVSAIAVLEKLASRPCLLQQLCRQVIRRCLGVPLARRVCSLGLPAMLQEYIQMKELDKLYGTLGGSNVSAVMWFPCFL